MFFKKTFLKVHDLVDKGSRNMQTLLVKAEGFVTDTEKLIKSSDNSIKVIAGFVIVTMGLQIAVSYTQLRINTKMLMLIRRSSL